MLHSQIVFPRQHLSNLHHRRQPHILSCKVFFGLLQCHLHLLLIRDALSGTDNSLRLSISIPVVNATLHLHPFIFTVVEPMDKIGFPKFILFTFLQFLDHLHGMSAVIRVDPVDIFIHLNSVSAPYIGSRSAFVVVIPVITKKAFSCRSHSQGTSLATLSASKSYLFLTASSSCIFSNEDLVAVKSEISSALQRIRCSLP